MDSVVSPPPKLLVFFGEEGFSFQKQNKNDFQQYAFSFWFSSWLQTLVEVDMESLTS